MAQKQIAWNTGGGTITITYTGNHSEDIAVKSTANPSFEERSQAITISTTEGSPKCTEKRIIRQAGKELGWKTKDFSYTGSVQEVTLPKGRYEVQCWGAQGGNSGNYMGYGSRGGYSHGIFTLDATTTIYIMVGGEGSTSGNGGWNGGGYSSGYSSYDSGDENGESWPGSGGGATDMCLVTSSMNYSGGRTNRSQASLLSRFIVAGGGGGGSSWYQTIETSETSTEYVLDNLSGNFGSYNSQVVDLSSYEVISYPYGDFFELGYLEADTYYEDAADFIVCAYTSSIFDANHFVKIAKGISGTSFVADGSSYYIAYTYGGSSSTYSSANSIYRTVTTTNTEVDYNGSSYSQMGGGINGGGYEGAGPSYAGSGGSFGKGGNQDTTNYRYVSGAGGGGWYGGGTSESDTDTSAVNDNGGGSGFVNIAANAKYRPNGYTGLQLNSGETINGGNLCPQPNGGRDYGNVGNGYARITVL